MAVDQADYLECGAPDRAGDSVAQHCVHHHCVRPEQQLRLNFSAAGNDAPVRKTESAYTFRKAVQIEPAVL